MLINEKYKVESDNLNVTVFEKKIVSGKRKCIKAAGEIYWYPIGYFSSPQAALQWLVRNEIMGDGMEDLKTVCKKIDELDKVINNLVKYNLCTECLKPLKGGKA